jgi:hypothetical protein
MSQNERRQSNRAYGGAVLAAIGRELRRHYEPEFDKVIPADLSDLLKRLRSGEQSAGEAISCRTQS